MTWTLLELQQTFSLLVGRLICEVYKRGVRLTFGETWRTPDQAELNAIQGKGIRNSLHCDRLAIDLNFFKEDKLLEKFDEIEQFGIYWKSLSTPGAECHWGGDFKSRDLGHFSIGHAGRK